MLWPKSLGWHSCFTIWPKPAFANFSAPAAHSLPQLGWPAPTLFSAESCSPSQGRLRVPLALLVPSSRCVPVLPNPQGTAQTLLSPKSYVVVAAAESKSHSPGLPEQLYAFCVLILTPNYYLWIIFLQDSGQLERRGPKHGAFHVAVSINDNLRESITDGSFNLLWGFSFVPLLSCISSTQLPTLLR